MGFFDMFKKKEEAAPVGPFVLGADAKGTLVPMEEIPDEVFAQGILGKCCGINPSEGVVYAPADGEITQAPDTLHALGILSTGGVEILIHVGVDTVEMKGQGFTANVKLGDKIQKGQKLLTMDLDAIAKAGHPAVVITVVTNTDDFADVSVVASGEVAPGEDMIKVSK
ncbi:MAG: PTS glucose transporter subunit IIA [Gemmiger sp.]|nr:PTS glucose transporter subunit IIA [Gemmiger sp.]